MNEMEIDDCLPGADKPEELPPSIRLRSYQHEMLEQTLKRNVIVVMETGSGKTNVAIARIRAELEKAESINKIVWFITPSVALGEQQYKAIQEQLSAYYVRTLMGSDGVDKWTEQSLWDATLKNVDVVIGTPAVLLDALTHAFVKMEALALLVFDEAHRCIKDSPMNVIMRDFYHASKGRGQAVPSILGLSASPVMNAKAGNLEKVEANLDAIAITPKRHREELERFVHPPQLERAVFAKSVQGVGGHRSSICMALETAFARYDLSRDPYVLELVSRSDDKSKRNLYEVLRKKRTYCSDQLRTLKARAETLMEQLGPSMAEWYIETCINRFMSGRSSETVLLPGLSEKEKEHLASILEWILTQKSITTPPLTLSTKAQVLIRLLVQNCSPSFRGIIFVEQRATVSALAQMLRTTPPLSTNFNIGSFVGTSSNQNRQSNVADLVSLKGQYQDLEDFRSGVKNLIVSTNVLEEGIDVSACNVVVCYDPPTNLVSFVQRRGRARNPESKYIIFLPDDNAKGDPAKWERLEAQMKEAYTSDVRVVGDREEQQDEEEEVRNYRVGDALLTLNNAKAHLYHFCATGIRTSSHVDLRPEFECVECVENGESNFTATLSLPSFVHHSVRTAASSRPWRSEGAAIKDATFEGYVALHKAGLVNDNLLPLVKDHGSQAGVAEHLDQPSIVRVAERLDCWTVEAECETVFHSCIATLWLRGAKMSTMTIWLPVAPADDISFSLYWNESTVYEVTVRSTKDVASKDEIELLRKSTHLLLKSIHGNRMSEKDDFLTLLSTVRTIDLPTWLDTMAGSRPAHEVLTGTQIDAERGLVQVKGQLGHAFIFQSLHQPALDIEDGIAERTQEPEVVVSSFPKRRNFLHPVVAYRNTVGEAHTAKQYLPLSLCTIGNLPATSALFAALMPSIVHRLDINSLVQCLQDSILSSVHISNPSLLLEAISSPAASEPTDYNRLEYLGDAILKFCTELQCMAQHPTWPEAYLSQAKDRIVCNGNLAKAAVHAGIDSFILTKSFTGSKWRPRYVSDTRRGEQETREMSSKVLADIVEALIGAAFVDGGLEKAFTCIKVLLPKETWFEHDDVFSSILLEVDAYPENKYRNLPLLEKLIGHHFTRPALLLEAITHASFGRGEGGFGMSYERLEFLGDAVLDLIITPKLFTHRRRLRHWDLHRMHEALVNSHILGFCCMEYAVEQETCHVSPSQQQVQTLTRQVHLHDFMRASPELSSIKRTSIDTFSGLRQKILEGLESQHLYPWSALIALSPQKFFSDLVESVLGALYLDTQGDISVCEAFLENLGLLRFLRRMLDEKVETAYPKETVGILADRKPVEYVAKQSVASGKRSWSCEVLVDGVCVVEADGCGSREEAEVRGAEEAAKILESQSRVESVDGARKRRRKLDDMVTEESQARGETD